MFAFSLLHENSSSHHENLNYQNNIDRFIKMFHSGTHVEVAVLHVVTASWRAVLRVWNKSTRGGDGGGGLGKEVEERGSCLRVK